MNRHLALVSRPLTSSLVGAVFLPFLYLVFVYFHGPLLPPRPGIGDTTGIYPVIVAGAALGLLVGWLFRRRHHRRQQQP